MNSIVVERSEKFKKGDIFVVGYHDEVGGNGPGNETADTRKSKELFSVCFLSPKIIDFTDFLACL